MENNEKIYNIYTDASFDNKTKLGTYSIAIIQENKILKAFGKMCANSLKNSVECEVFAIFQAMNIIESQLIKEEKNQKFHINTDCIAAKDFFSNEKINPKIFKNNLELLNKILNIYKRIKKKLSNKKCSFTIEWVSKKNNKIAHKQSYSIFKKIKGQKIYNNIVVIDKEIFLEILQKFSSNQYKILNYLFQNSNEEKKIIKTKKEISKSLGITIYSVNKTFQELINLNILLKIQNGYYILLV